MRTTTKSPGEKIVKDIKHGRQTKGKLAAQRHAAMVGRRVMSELKRLESQLDDAGLMPDGD